MMREACETALRHPNVAAMLRVIRAGETNQADAAYRMQFGGHLFDAPPWTHPREAVTAAGLRSTAAGAYQFLATTWDECAKALELADFSPGNQDLAAVYLMQRRGAIGRIQAGELEAAVKACASIWASLPGSPYGQPTITLALCRETFAKYGGTLAADAAPAAQAGAGDAQAAPTPQPTSAPAGAPTAPPVQSAGLSQPTKGARMPVLALLSAFGPVLANLIPQLASIFAPKGEVAQRNLKVAEVALDTITAAAGAANVQDAVEKMQADPQLVQTVTQAVVTQPDIMRALTLPADAEKAVERSIVIQNSERPFWYNPLVWVTAALLPMMYLLTAAVLFLSNAGLATDGTVAAGAAWYTVLGFDPSTRSGLVNLIVGFVFGGVTGVWFGTSASSQRSSNNAAPAAK